jgi:hypothetical protein
VETIEAGRRQRVDVRHHGSDRRVIELQQRARREVAIGCRQRLRQHVSLARNEDYIEPDQQLHHGRARRVGGAGAEAHECHPDHMIELDEIADGTWKVLQQLGLDRVRVDDEVWLGVLFHQITSASTRG